MTAYPVTLALKDWFTKPLYKLPRAERSLAQSHIENWSELSPRQRRAHAFEVDRQRWVNARSPLTLLRIEQERKGESPVGRAEQIIAWDDDEMDAYHWFSLADVEPVKAAMLLCRLNPNSETLAEADSNSTDETVPRDFMKLRQRFEDLSRAKPGSRTLRDWLHAAKEMQARYHSWIDEYVEAVALRNPAPTPAPESAAAPGMPTTPAPRSPSEVAATESAPVAAHPWMESARIEARRIRKAAEAKGWFPNLKKLGDEVADVFNQKKIFGPNGHALSGAHIARNALQGHGITKPADKLRSMRSTPGHRGK